MSSEVTKETEEHKPEPAPVEKRKSGFDWRYGLTLLVAAGISAGLVVGYQSGIIGRWLQRKPAVVLLDEMAVYHYVFEVDKDAGNSAKSAIDAGNYVGKVMDQTIKRYQERGIAVALSGQTFVVPKQDDITAQVEARIARHFGEKGGKGKS